MRLIAIVIVISILAGSGCDTSKLKLKENDDGVRIYLPTEIGIVEHFQNNRVIVTGFEKDEIDDPETEGRETQTHYPSINVKNKSPWYPHIIRVKTLNGIDIDIDKLNPSTTMLILKLDNEEDLYYLIGTWSVPASERAFDFFEDKPEYLFRNNKNNQ